MQPLALNGWLHFKKSTCNVLLLQSFTGVKLTKIQFNPREITIFFPRKMPESNILCRKDSSLVVIFGNKTDQFEAAELHLFFLKHFCTTEAIPITELYRHELSCIIYLQR